MPTSERTALLERTAQLRTEAETIITAGAAAADGMTAEQRDRLAAITGELERINGDMRVMDAARAAVAESARPITVPGAIPAPDPSPVGATGSQPRIQVREHTSLFGYRNLGEQLLAIRQAGMGRAIDPRLDASHVYQRLEAAASGGQEAVGADGGFLLDPTFANDIMPKITGGSEIISRLRAIPVTGNSLTVRVSAETSRATGSRWGGVRAYWVDEAGAPTASRPKFDQIEMKLRKLAALGYATDELLADAPALGAVITQAFADELRWMLEDAVIEGDGAGQPLGIMNAPALVTITKESGQTAGTVVSGNILNMWKAMPPNLRSGAVWLVSPDVEAALPGLNYGVSTAGGQLVFMPAGGLTGAQFSTLMGRPVLPVEYCKAIGTTGDIMLVNLSQYLFISKGGVQQDSSMHVLFTTDEMAFRAIWRVDGQPGWKSKVTPVNGSFYYSPFVVVETRS